MYWVISAAIVIAVIMSKIPSYFLEIHTPPPLIRPPQRDGRIFVSIACYRDPECYATIRSLFANAASPSMLDVCVCLQATKAERDHFYEETRDLPLLIIDVDHAKARGPTWARYLIQKQWKGQQYYLQTDSHMRFAYHWDTLLLDQLVDNKTCITTYVPRYDIRTGDVEDRKRGGLVVREISPEDGFPRYDAPYDVDDYESRGWAACFSFSSSELINDAPYDSYTPHLFFGEEFDIYARLWTRGWSFVAPRETVCWTSFDRSYRPFFKRRKDIERISRMRLYNRLFGRKQVPFYVLSVSRRYALGDIRKL